MNYWLLTTEFPPFFGGGISTYCEQTVRMLSERGHAVTVFIPQYDSAEVLEEQHPYGTTIRFNPSTSATVKFLGFEANLSFAFAELVLNRIKASGAPDFIEAQEYLGIAYYLLQKKHLGYPGLENTKIVLTLHAPTFLYLDYNQVPVYKHPNFWTGEMERFCIRAADCCISPSAYLIEALRPRVELWDIPIHVVPNPFTAVYEEKPVPGFTPLELVFYGKLIPQKGCIELLRYLAEYWEEGFKGRLRMVGGGSHLFHPLQMDLAEHFKQKYKKYIDLGLLLIEGEIKPRDLFSELGKAHVILIPSIVDNLPYAVLECMSIGKVVLTSKQGGQAEIITPGSDGFLFDHEVKGDFKRVLAEILSLSGDDIERIGKQASVKVKNNYAPSFVYEQKMDILETVKQQTAKTDFPFIRPPRKSDAPVFEPAEGLLTVVVPYYNMGKYLPDAVESILNSDYTNTEVVIVNDGSTDAYSLSVLNWYEGHDQVRVIHKKNEGLALARNTGAQEAAGSLLAFLDPDDSVAPAYYFKAVEVLLAKPNLSFVGCWANYFGAAAGTWPTFNPEPPYVLLHNCMNTSAMVYKKSHFLKAGLNDARMIYGMEDYESMLSMLEQGMRGVSFPEPWWDYRIRKDSMAQSFTTNSKLYLYKLMAEKHPAFYAQYASELFLLLNSNGPSIHIDNPTLNRGLYSRFTLSKIGQKLIFVVKKNKFLRPIAIRIYKRLGK